MRLALHLTALCGLVSACSKTPPGSSSAPAEPPRAPDGSTTPGTPDAATPADTWSDSGAAPDADGGAPSPDGAGPTPTPDAGTWDSWLPQGLDGNVQAEPPLPPPEVVATIGPQGGEITHGPIRLLVPPGALLDATDVGISLLESETFALSAGGAGRGVELQPHGLVFYLPATLEATFDAPIPEERDVDHLVQTSEGLTWLGDAAISADRTTASVELEHFSKHLLVSQLPRFLLDKDNLDWGFLLNGKDDPADPPSWPALAPSGGPLWVSDSPELLTIINQPEDYCPRAATGSALFKGTLGEGKVRVMLHHANEGGGKRTVALVAVGSGGSVSIKGGACVNCAHPLDAGWRAAALYLSKTGLAKVEEGLGACCTAKDDTKTATPAGTVLWQGSVKTNMSALFDVEGPAGIAIYEMLDTVNCLKVGEPISYQYKRSGECWKKVHVRGAWGHTTRSGSLAVVHSDAADAHNGKVAHLVHRDWSTGCSTPLANWSAAKGGQLALPGELEIGADISPARPTACVPQGETIFLDTYDPAGKGDPLGADAAVNTGNYGVDYTLPLEITNPTAEAQRYHLLFSSRGKTKTWDAAGILYALDDELHMLISGARHAFPQNPNLGHVLGRFDVPAGGKVQKKFLFTPPAGANLPYRFLVVPGALVKHLTPTWEEKVAPGAPIAVDFNYRLHPGKLKDGALDPTKVKVTLREVGGKAKWSSTDGTLVTGYDGEARRLTVTPPAAMQDGRRYRVTLQGFSDPMAGLLAAKAVERNCAELTYDPLHCLTTKGGGTKGVHPCDADAPLERLPESKTCKAGRCDERWCWEFVTAPPKPASVTSFPDVFGSCVTSLTLDKKEVKPGDILRVDYEVAKEPNYCTLADLWVTHAVRVWDVAPPEDLSGGATTLPEIWHLTPYCQEGGATAGYQPVPVQGVAEIWDTYCPIKPPANGIPMPKVVGKHGVTSGSLWFRIDPSLTAAQVPTEKPGSCCCQTAQCVSGPSVVVSVYSQNLSCGANQPCKQATCPFGETQCCTKLEGTGTCSDELQNRGTSRVELFSIVP